MIFMKTNLCLIFLLYACAFSPRIYKTTPTALMLHCSSRKILMICTTHSVFKNMKWKFLRKVKRAVNTCLTHTHTHTHHWWHVWMCVFLPPDQIHFTSSSVKSFVGVLWAKHDARRNRIYANNLIWKSFNGFFFFLYVPRAWRRCALATAILIYIWFQTPPSSWAAYAPETFVYYVNYDVLYSFV